MRILVAIIFLFAFLSCDEEPSTSYSARTYDSGTVAYVQSEGIYALSQAERAIAVTPIEGDGMNVCVEIREIRKDYREKLSRHGVRPTPVIVRAGSFKDQAQNAAYEYDHALDSLLE